MERYSKILLDVWREACRHIEIAEATDLITPLILRQLPLDQLVLRIVDLERGVVDTVAATARDHRRPKSRLRSECTPDAIDRLFQWCRRGEVLHDSTEALQERLPGLLPEDVAGDILAGPLNTAEGPSGVLVFVATSTRLFTAEHEELLKVLVEPFTVALENDRRLRELTALREKVEAENRSLLTKLGRNDLSDAIVGVESGLRGVMDRVSLVARADIPVLILGETGSGKEVLARAIHKQSRRDNGPFLRVNCGAIPPELVDSELFGHERGSFTGATALRKGWFERADRGTLFLDECGELPPAAQVRLLRILQDGTFERVGGERQIHVDVRVVAATHRNLQAMVGEGTFREDLWYRLAVFPIHLPPLRDRPEDIAALAAHFALRAAKRFGLPARTPTPEDVNLLAKYNWPGNVRELASVIERAAILGNGLKLDVTTALGVVPQTSFSESAWPQLSSPTSQFSPLPRDFSLPSAQAAIQESHSRPQASRIASTRPIADFSPLDSAMRQHIEAALQRTRGRIEGPHGAAKLLGINPHTLRARMRKLKINWRNFRPAEDVV
ncbi:MAG TPA: sigma-54-dependent Fis family transcriptional regulator [Pirellulales bacterium]|nr:sigma-54-dependent Fis family transcriptional regulator [Pirellulales bacterium]